MMTYNNVYPYFDKLIDNIILEIVYNIELTRYKDPKVLLHILLEKLEHLKVEMGRKPTLSATNIQNTINSVYLKAKKGNILLDGAILPIHFVENANITRFAKMNPIILAK